MNDVILLGVISLGLAFYCLYLRMKLKFFMYATQLILQGVHKNEVIVVERSGVYYPELKKSIEQ